MINIQVFNLLIHYGENYQKNLVDLFEDGFSDVLHSDAQWGKPPHVCYIKDPKLISKPENQLYLSGYFHRGSKLQWDFIPSEDQKAIESPGSQNVMPVARFIIDLMNHRLIWVTESGKTHKPTAKNFKSFLKSNMLKKLRTKYTDLANIAYEKLKEQKIDLPKKSEFRREFLIKNNIRNELLKVALIPVVAPQEFDKFFKEPQYVIKQVKFKPHISNPTNDDFKSLFVNTAKFASSAKGKVEVNLKAMDSEVGIKKNEVKQVLDENRKKQLLDIEMSVSDTKQKGEKPFKISNHKDSMKSDGVTDISLKFQFDLQINSSEIIPKSVQKLKNMGLEAKKTGTKLADRFKKSLGRK